MGFTKKELIEFMDGLVEENVIQQVMAVRQRRKAFVKRNSFIEMAKLHNLSGRIIYISSHAKQEHLYEVYATEPDKAFWREFARCNQEEFEKNGGQI